MTEEEILEFREVNGIKPRLLTSEYSSSKCFNKPFTDYDRKISAYLRSKSTNVGGRGGR